MRLLMPLLTFMLASTLLHASSGSEDPGGHQRLVMENGHVRVIEYFASPGGGSGLAAQPSGVRVSLSKSRFRAVSADGRERIVDYFPGQVEWVDQAGSETWTLLAGDAHLMFVDVKSVGQGQRFDNVATRKDHSSIVDPDQHHLVLDNAHVRILDGFGKPGNSSPAHSHPPSVLVSLSKSRFRVTIGGRTRIFDFEPGMVRWTNHFSHEWEILTGDARVIMIEIKSADADPAFAER